MTMFDWIRHLLDVGNEKCFEKHKNSDGVCYGLMGSNRNTEYLSESCIGCKYHTMPQETYRKENSNGKR